MVVLVDGYVETPVVESWFVVDVFANTLVMFSLLRGVVDVVDNVDVVKRVVDRGSVVGNDVGDVSGTIGR